MEKYARSGYNMDKASKEKVQKCSEDIKFFLSSFIKDLKTKSDLEKYLKEINFDSSQLINKFEEMKTMMHQFQNAMHQSQVLMGNLYSFYLCFLSLVKSLMIPLLTPQKKAVFYLELINRLTLFQYVKNIKAKDITNSNKEAYAQVWSKISIQKIFKSDRAAEEYTEMKNILNATLCTVIDQEEYEFALTKKITTPYFFPKYFLMTDICRIKVNKFYLNPKLSIAKKFWDYGEEGIAKQVINLSFDSIKTNCKIYIPFEQNSKSKLDIFKYNQDAVSVRVLFNEQLHSVDREASMGCCIPIRRPKKKIDTIIVHIHGGGFIALSSFSYQYYTRKWANALNIPIFSIDYRKPPQYKFPIPLEDCYLVYKFLVSNIHHHLNVKPKNIILVGDSAGGNLACSLTGLIIKNKLMKPKSLYLIYPAVDLSFTFTHSLLNSFNDAFLNIGMLRLCLQSYLNKIEGEIKNPLANSIILSEQYVGGAQKDSRFPLAWPKTLITTGLEDPLLDATLMLMQRMVKSGVNCECRLYQGLYHGYLNTAALLSQSKKTINLSIADLQNLISNEK